MPTMPMNPYSPGAGVVPPVLVGREQQLAILRSIADRVEAGRSPQHVILTGLRGVGKSVLVKECLSELRERGWLGGYFEVRRGAELGVALGTIIEGGSSALPRGARWRRTLKNFSQSIGGVTLSGSPDGTVSVSVARRDAPGGDVYTQARSVLTGLANAARAEGVGVVLAIDEIQTFPIPEATTLLQVLESSEAADSRILLLGAGLPKSSAHLVRARTYAERFRYERLDDVARDDARRAIREPADNLGVTWTPGALSRVVELADGYPYFLQLYASEAWETASIAGAHNKITLHHVELAVPRVTRQLDDGMYRARWRNASPKARLYLRTMVELMDASGVVRSASVAESLGTDLAGLSRVRDNLLGSGVIHSPSLGELSFAVPHFDEFVRRQIEDDSDER